MVYAPFFEMEMRFQQQFFFYFACWGYGKLGVENKKKLEEKRGLKIVELRQKRNKKKQLQLDITFDQKC